MSERIPYVGGAGSSIRIDLNTKGDGPPVTTQTAHDVRTAQRQIPFGRPMISAAERSAVLEVLDGPILTHGPRVKAFEDAFARYTGARHAIAVSTATAGLHLAYMYLEIGPGDEVIVPALTHVATAHAVELCGGRCVFVDAEDATGNIDLDRIAAVVTERTKAISVVHFLGVPVDMQPVRALADKHNLFIVEDCALALGAFPGGRHAGLVGDVGVFSFYPVKHITTAEGGMVITDRDDVAESLRKKRAFGIDRNVVGERPEPGQYDVVTLGNNYRMSELGAALGIEQMQRLDGFLAQRRSNQRELARGLAGTDSLRLMPPEDLGQAGACYCQNIILEENLAPHRGEIIRELADRGIGVSVYYPHPVPNLQYFQAQYGHRDDDFPVASGLCRRCIALPVGPHLQDGDARYIAESVIDVIDAVRGSTS